MSRDIFNNQWGRHVTNSAVYDESSGIYMSTLKLPVHMTTWGAFVHAYSNGANWCSIAGQFVAANDELGFSEWIPDRNGTNIMISGPSIRADYIVIGIL